MIWIKTNSQEIEVNDLPATIAHCEQLGWTRKGDKPAELPEKKKDK